jgi:hypothetical protein
LTQSPTTESSPVRSFAVQLCRQAHLRSIELSKARNLDSYDTREEASRAYREAMPHLTTPAGICDFIACVTYGMIIDVFDATDGSKLLYAAQVAIGALRKQSPSETPPAP